MPSPIAHAVTGYVLSRLWPVRSDLTLSQQRFQSYYGVFVAIAADFDFIPQFLTGEQFHRGITHTIIFDVLFSLVLAWFFFGRFNCSYRRAVLFTMMVYSSHLVLDLVTTGGQGLQLLWPLTDTYFKAPFPLFPPVHHSRGLLDPSHLIFFAWEFCYSLLILSGLRFWENSKFSKFSE
ncbi:MAG: metal-dependent hydrolase [Microcoleaceae cyanobacterium]